VRIGAYGLVRNSADKIVNDAQETGVFGIEVDNDIPGRYESFLNPKAKLEADSGRSRKSALRRKLCLCVYRRNRMHHGPW